METKPEQLVLDSEENKARESLPEYISWGRRQLKVSKVFWTYWKFASERQAIFFRRLRGSQPWTHDSILRTFRFTNVYRASDRVSQYMIRKVAYQGDQTPMEVFFRILLFKLFNRIETWELLQNSFGQISYSDHKTEAYETLLTKALEAGKKIYSAAYIMPSGGSRFEGRKHSFHLRVLDRMMRDAVPLRISQMTRMSDAFALLRSYPGIGDFLAYQFVIDINYTTLCNFPEMEFVMPGPGAKDGIKKCFPEVSMSESADIIRFVTEAQEEYFALLRLPFANLWGRRLQLIDCQNLFCEVDKYARYAHPEITGLTGRTRIKQMYRPSVAPLVLFYPPKWGINEIIPELLRAA